MGQPHDSLSDNLRLNFTLALKRLWYHSLLTSFCLNRKVHQKLHHQHPAQQQQQEQQLPRTDILNNHNSTDSLNAINWPTVPSPPELQQHQEQMPNQQIRDNQLYQITTKQVLNVTLISLQRCPAPYPNPGYDTPVHFYELRREHF